ncbi:PAS domain S-box protein [Calothrix sp. FACHB-156]|nr:PAS domain S-box protein [Calothrix sp. FACHB-156]
MNNQEQDTTASASEAAFFFERSLDLLSVIGMDGYFKRINPAFTQILGYSKAELLASPFLDFVHPDDHSVTLAEMEKLKAGAPTLNFENRYRTKDGRYRWWEWTASPAIDQDVIYCVARDITEQKDTEAALERANQKLEQRIAERTAQLEQVNAALQESEQRNQLAMEVARIFTFEWELHTDVVKRSPQCGVILGLTSTEAELDTGANFFQRVHLEDRDRFIAVLKALTPENSTYKTTYRVVRPDGQIVTFEESARALFDEQGQLTRLIGITADVTERQRLEAELQEIQATLQRQLAEIETIYQSAPIGLNVLDPDLRFVRINQRLAEINGFSTEEHIGRTIRELLPDIADTAEALLRPIFETGEPLLNVEIRGETPAQPGIERVWLESFLPLKDGDRVIGINTVCQEITDHKQVEEALRRSEERYRTLFETMEDGFCVVEMLFDENTTPIDYRFLEINPAFERETGLQQAIGKTARQLLPNLEKFWFETYGRVALTGEPVRFENGSDAMNRWFEVYAFPIEGPEKHKVAILFKNISDRKAIEAQREKLLQQEQAAREAAERANRMKDEFLAILSHELRTPLNPILGWTKILQSPKITPDKIQYGLNTIERNAQQQVQLIDDLLDISRIIRGKLSLSFAAINLSEPITAAVETVSLAAEAKAIQFEVLLDPKVGYVKGDASRLQQVVWNLLSNAIKFTPSGGQVTVQLTRADCYAQIQVTDTGNGIKPEFLPHVFELFQQQDSSTTRAFGGLGLGLAIARQVVEAHGGKIAVASAGEGLGATFSVQLPLMSVSNINILDSCNNPTLNLKDRRVIVVDDELDSLELVKVVLEEEGAVVEVVSSATNALPVLIQAPFDLLISDIGMPEMDGYNFIRQIRALPPQFNRNIPAIALTAYAGEANKLKILAAGFQAHLAKPIEPQNLLDAIAALMISN